MICDMEAPEETQHTAPASTAQLRRRRLLYSCGASALTVARKAYHRVEGLDGPLGSLAKKLSSWVSPVLHPLQHRWLSLLSFADGCVLAAEDAAVSVLPPAAHLFDVLDRLALLSESARKKFDDAADQLPAMLRRAPLVGWAAAELGRRCSKLLQLASVWESRKEGDEREIAVDAVEHPAAVGSSGTSPDEKGKAAAKSEEEMLEEQEATARKAAEEEEEAEEMVRVKDPILVLFDEGWCGA